MNKRFLCLITCFSVLLNISHAEDLSVKENKIEAQKVSHNQDKDLLLRGLTVNQDDVIEGEDTDEIVLTEEQLRQAKVWDLDEAQEKRYLQLMNNRSGLYFKDLKMSPVQILGINARNEEERAKYAALYAKQEQLRIAKLLAWSAIASDQYKLLTSHIAMVNPINTEPFSPYAYKAIELKSHDRLVLFVTSHTDVKRIMTTLLADSTFNEDVQLNIYFIDKPSNEVIQQWAAHMNIPIKAVASNKITLNTSSGPYETVANQGKPPLLFLIRDNNTESVDVSRF